MKECDELEARGHKFLTAGCGYRAMTQAELTLHTTICQFDRKCNHCGKPFKNCKMVRGSPAVTRKGRRLMHIAYRQHMKWSLHPENLTRTVCQEAGCESAVAVPGCQAPDYVDSRRTSAEVRRWRLARGTWCSVHAHRRGAVTVNQPFQVADERALGEEEEGSSGISGTPAERETGGDHTQTGADEEEGQQSDVDTEAEEADSESTDGGWGSDWVRLSQRTIGEYESSEGSE